MGEEFVKAGWNFEWFDGEFGKPLLEESVGAEVVAVELVSAGPRDKQRGGGEEDKAVGVRERKAMLGPSDEERL